MSSRWWLIAVLVLLWGSVAQAGDKAIEAVEPSADTSGFFAAAEGHGSILSDVAGATLLNLTYGWALKGGHRWGGWGAFVQVEQNLWRTAEFNAKTVQGALNIGLGGEVLYAGGFVRTSLALGPSVLLFDTVLDDAGTVGLFMDLRPAGLRWRPHESVALLLDPISFAIVAPVLDGIPLVQVEYRTVFATEVVF